MLKVREWSATKPDDGSIHAMGNGHMIVYGQGPELWSIVGPPYTAPSFARLRLGDAPVLHSVSEREPRTALWTHALSADGRALARVSDGLLPDANLFFRDIRSEGDLLWIIEPDPSAQCAFLPAYLGGTVDSLLITLPKATPFNAGYATCQESCLLIAVQGAAVLRQANGRFEIRVSPGESRLLFGSHTAYPALVTCMENALAADSETMRAAARRAWHAFRDRGHDFAKILPPHPLRAEILEAIDSVAVLIKAQQSASGGVAAGHYYPMAYVRDQAGVLRGLLALGYAQEAKAILAFWLRKWEIYGDICNAEGMDNDGSRLLFGNDEVEIPAYILNCAFLYRQATGDDAFLARLLPFLRYAFEIQLGHIVEGMLEFSGDETYIAGNTFPRYCMFHGSAEATLLFIVSGEALLAYCREKNALDAETEERYARAVRTARNAYAQNFVEDGILYGNQPSREASAGKPRFRFSFCDAHEHLTITWCEKNAAGFYVCPQCRHKATPLPENTVRRYLLASAALSPAYLHSDLFTRDELAGFVQPVLDIYKEKGYVPSCAQGARALGYDYGLLLYALSQLDHSMAETVLEKTLSLLDPTGAWVEYYDEDKPYNCRARPWESAINIEAIIAHMLRIRERQAR